MAGTLGVDTHPPGYNPVVAVDEQAYLGFRQYRQLDLGAGEQRD
jgi:hypothetical protein